MDDARTRLTEKLVRAQKPAAIKFPVHDDDMIGLALIVYPSGRKSFILSYRWAGRPKRMTIGGWPDWTVTAAREQARALRRDIDAGYDPLSERNKKRDAPRVSDLIDKYIAEHVPHLSPRNGSDQTSMLTKMVLPKWRDLLVSEVTDSDVNILLNEVAAGRGRPKKNGQAGKVVETPIRANRCGEVLRKMFTLAIKWKMRDDNPAAGFYKRTEREIERYLTADEVDRLAEALLATRDQRAATIIRLCLLTGSRVGEVRTARFDQFNLELLLWTKPASNTKQRKEHRVPIGAEVAAFVRLRRLSVPSGCPFLFPGDLGDDQPVQPVTEIRRFWRGIQRDAALPDVRVHDLRHTFASLMISGGMSLPMVGKLLGHTQHKTTQRYAHLAEGPLREGVNSLNTLLAPRPKAVDNQSSG